MTTSLERPSSDAIRPQVLSLGAGVQSTTLALLAAHSVIGPIPDCAIFSDTGWESERSTIIWRGSPHCMSRRSDRSERAENCPSE